MFGPEARIPADVNWVTAQVPAGAPAMLEVPVAVIEETARRVQELMTTTAYDETKRVGRPWVVPVDVEWGPRWDAVTHTLDSDGKIEKKEKEAA